MRLRADKGTTPSRAGVRLSCSSLYVCSIGQATHPDLSESRPLRNTSAGCPGLASARAGSLSYTIVWPAGWLTVWFASRLGMLAPVAARLEKLCAACAVGVLCVRARLCLRARLKAGPHRWDDARALTARSISHLLLGGRGRGKGRAGKAGEVRPRKRTNARELSHSSLARGHELRWLAHPAVSQHQQLQARNGLRNSGCCGPARTCTVRGSLPARLDPRLCSPQQLGGTDMAQQHPGPGLVLRNRAPGPQRGSLWPGLQCGRASRLLLV